MTTSGHLRDDLPDLTSVEAYDERLRQYASDPVFVADAIALAEARLANAGPGEELRLRGYLGNACRMVGRLDEAVAHLQRAIALAQAQGNERAQVANVIRLGEARKFQNRIADAERLFRDALALATDPTAPALRVYESFALQHLGKCLIEQERREEAIDVLTRALELRRREGDIALITSTEAALRLARTS